MSTHPAAVTGEWSLVGAGLPQSSAQFLVSDGVTL
jgi:hypothetical protein